MLSTELLSNGLLAAGIGQGGVALLNLFLVRLVGFGPDLKRVGKLTREVFLCHLWFISITVAIFAAITIRFHDGMASGAVESLRWVATAIGIFWGLRTVLQITHYSGEHWKGKKTETAIHIALLIAYGGMAALYLYAGLL